MRCRWFCKLRRGARALPVCATWLMLLAAPVLQGCVGTTDIQATKRVVAPEPLSVAADVWIGSRSASVQTSALYPPLEAALAAQLKRAGFGMTTRPEDAQYQAYLWYGKRAERREQFSNVTDGINIATEYTWVLTLEMTSKAAMGQEQRYFAEVQAATWCPSIDSLLPQLTEVLLVDFPQEASYERTLRVPITPSEC